MHTADDGLEVRVPVNAGTHRSACRSSRRYWEPEGVLQPPQRGFARTTNELYTASPRWTTSPIAGPYRGEPAQSTRRAAARSSCAGRSQRAAEEACAGRFCRRSRVARIGGPVTEHGGRDAAGFLQGGRARGRLRGRHSAGAGAHPGVSELPVPDRTRAGERRAGHGLSPQRYRSGVAAVVLPLEQHSRRRAARRGRARHSSQDRRCWSSRSGGCSPIRARRRWSTTSPVSG